SASSSNPPCSDLLFLLLVFPRPDPRPLTVTRHSSCSQQVATVPAVQSAFAAERRSCASHRVSYLCRGRARASDRGCCTSRRSGRALPSSSHRQSHSIVSLPQPAFLRGDLWEGPRWPQPPIARR